MLTPEDALKIENLVISGPSNFVQFVKGKMFSQPLEAFDVKNQKIG